MKNVFFSVSDGHVVCEVDDESYTCETSEDIVASLQQNNVTSENCEIMASSSVDFCEEEGMEPGQADELIDDALDTLNIEAV